MKTRARVVARRFCAFNATGSESHAGESEEVRESASRAVRVRERSVRHQMLCVNNLSVPCRFLKVCTRGISGKS